MNRFKINDWIFKKKTKDVTLSYEVKQKAKYVKGSIIAIVLGLILAGIVIAVQNVNPFTYLKYLFDISFSDLYVDQTIQWLTIYIIAGLAVAIGFKAGLFNIGVSGQMLLGGGLSIIFYKMVVENSGKQLTAGYIIVMFIICMFSGALLSGIAGVLKAVFNIHEVVTTIMLNWSIWYLLKFLFVKYAQKIGGPGISTSAAIPSGHLSMNGSEIAIPIIIAAVCLIAVALLLAKTVFGYKLKSVGSSTTASRYAGFDVKKKIIQAMLISGAFAGIASFINIMTITPNLTFTVDNLPSIGYDSIAISLVAFNNPIGIFFTGFLWAVLQSGGSSAASLFNMPNQMSSLVFGIIVYFAAISVIFMQFYPILKMKMMVATQHSKKQNLKISELRKEQNKIRVELINVSKSESIVNFREAIDMEKEELYKIYNSNPNQKEAKQDYKNGIKVLNKQMNNFVSEYKKNLKENSKQISNEIHIIKKQTYEERISSAKTGVLRRRFKDIKKVENIALKDLSVAKSEALSRRDEIKKQYKEKNNWLSIQLQNLKVERDKKLRANNVWLEGNEGELTHYYNMFNGTVEIKGELKKNELKMSQQIQSIRADYRMKRMELINIENTKNISKLRELRLEKNNTIKKIKDEFKKYKNDQMIKINNLKKDYIDTKKYLESETNQLKELRKKHTVKVQEITTKYWNNIKLLKSVNLDSKDMINNAISKSNYIKVQKLLKDYKNELSQIDNTDLIESNNVKKITLDMLIKNIKQIWPDDYAVYDNKKWTSKRKRVYIWLVNQELTIAKEKIVLLAQVKIDNIDKSSKFVLENYNENLSTFKKEYKTNKDQIIKNKTIDAYTRRVLLAKEQDGYEINIESYINQLEDIAKEAVN